MLLKQLLAFLWILGLANLFHLVLHLLHALLQLRHLLVEFGYVWGLAPCLPSVFYRTGLLR